MLLPHIKDKNATEEKLFPLYFEKQNPINFDLQKEIELVNEQKENFWKKIDAMKKGNA
jgi:hypothetical protein